MPSHDEHSTNLANNPERYPLEPVSASGQERNIGINRRQFVTGLAGLAAFSGTYARSSSARRPNIVLFLIDDLGWGDLGCYGNLFHETPNIDRLCADGLRFTNAYATAPVCSPSRAGILTGQWPARLHLTQWIPGVQYPHKKLIEPPTPAHLDLSVPVLAQLLKRQGYRTAAIGKWHLGGVGYLPENFGFDVNIAGDEHGHPGPPNHYFGPFHYHNLADYTKRDYLTDVLTQKMDDFLQTADRENPFFLYMAEYAVHLPLEARNALIEKYRRKAGGKDEPNPIYAAMIERVDIAVGDLRTRLQRAGVADNTIILLTSDNGGVGFQGRDLHRIADNGGLRAGKGFLYEGGIREPLIVNWPGVVKPGSICDVPVTGTDFMPTILSMAGAGTPPLPCDGIDISGLLRGHAVPERHCLYWHYPHYSDQGGTPTGAIRDKEWKLIEFFEDGHLELYNLALDPGEQYDLSSSFSDKAAALHEKLVAWRNSQNALMPKPNPDYNPLLADLSRSHRGCSWEPSAHCLED